MSQEVSLQGRSFLVVDDEEFVRGLVVRLLRSLGASVVESAGDGQEAAQVLRNSEFQFDCVLTDFEMKPQNGLQLLAAIRSGDGGLKRNLPVLMLTAHSDTALVSTAFRLDTNGFLLKPPTKATLADRLERIIAKPLVVRSQQFYHEIVELYGLTGAPASGQESADDPSDRISDDRKKPSVVLSGINRAGKPGAEPTESADSDEAPPSPSFGPSIQLPLAEVLVGSVLARDLIAGGGGLLLRSHAVLTERLIERLIDLYEIDRTLKTVWVHPPIPTT